MVRKTNAVLQIDVVVCSFRALCHSAYLLKYLFVSKPATVKTV